MKLSPEVQKFAEAMQTRYTANKWRGDWRKDKPRHHIKRALEEWYELSEAVKELLSQIEEGDPEATEYIAHQAADVGIYAMFAIETIGEYDPEHDTNPQWLHRVCAFCDLTATRRVWSRHICAADTCDTAAKAEWVTKQRTGS
jgi:NTP pyrophosphatase (non-canonical NTP hydrolase)